MGFRALGGMGKGRRRVSEYISSQVSEYMLYEHANLSFRIHLLEFRNTSFRTLW